MAARLTGQKALVTGANSGIGESIAKALASAGAAVVVNYLTRADAAQRVVSEIRAAGGEAVALQADVSDERQVRALFRRAIDALGTVDILVNNAGIQRDAPFHELSLLQWNQVIAVNLTGAFLCSREAVREFFRRGVVPEVSRAAGKIVCISSVHEVVPWAGHANYAASKGGLSMLMRTMAQELAPQKIRVNAICPGAIRTNINRAAWEDPEAQKELLRLVPYGRIGNPEDVANVAAWLVSDEADYVCGASLFVDAGMSLFPGFRTAG